MTRFWTGVSGFSYPSWKGVFYPKDTKADRMLEAYSKKLNSVEINFSFYHMPTQSTTSKWSKSTQDNFRFSFKANRKVTHYKKLRDTAVEMNAFFDGVKPVEPKLGSLLVQLPPYMKQDYEVLATFLEQKPKSIRVALEFRHESWFNEKLYELLSRHNAALSVADTEDMKPVFRNTANFTYVRLRHERYSKNELRDWAHKLLKFAGDSSDAYVYFKHDETGDAANMAAEFRTMLEG
jgi:uncharacterized protein YecE (DUF72 family)